MKHVDAASVQSRALAAVVDGSAASALFWCLLQSSGRFTEVELVLFLFFGLVVGAIASSVIFPGQSPGKAVARILVLSVEGGALSRLRQVARDSLRLFVPFIACFGFAAGGIASLVQAFAMAVSSTAALELLVQSVRTDRRSAVDLLLGTRVVRLPPLQPHRAPAAPMYSATDVEFGNPPRLPSRDA